MNYSHLETIIVSRDRLTDVIRTVQAHLKPFAGEKLTSDVYKSDNTKIKNALAKY